MFCNVPSVAVICRLDEIDRSLPDVRANEHEIMEITLRCGLMLA